ncbi:MAG: heme o synthase [Alphaproteobacteria bacterium]
MTDISATGFDNARGQRGGAHTLAPVHDAARWQDYVALLKPRVMSLVIFTGLVGMVMAPGTETLHPVIAFTAILCIAVGAGAAAALNMWYDADIDAVMIRTRKRPVPRGVVRREDAAAMGAVLAGGSVAVMGLAVNAVAAALLALTIGFYLFVYTMWLKRRTPQNIVIGGAAGALPPMIGWASVTGGIAPEPFILFLIIFLWTPPHFWALSLYRAGDYQKAGVPMMPVVAGRQATRAQIFGYALVLGAASLMPLAFGFAGWLYAAVAVPAGAAFAGLAWRLWRLGRSAEGDPVAEKRAEHAARRLFAFSIFYLFALFLALLIEAIAGAGSFGSLL